MTDRAIAIQTEKAGARLCSIPECGKPICTRGYCGSHYERLRKHGDPLGGGTSHGDPMRFIHEVAIHHTGDDCLIWPFGKNNKGYGNLWIDGKQAIASRYVCELAHGAPPTPDHEASHSCGKGHEACISPIHLDWKTQAENKADMLAHGTYQRGERHGQAKLKDDEAREILALRGIKTQRELAERFGISRGTVSDIHAGRIWAWLHQGIAL